jgi:hypothetical protein
MSRARATESWIWDSTDPMSAVWSGDEDRTVAGGLEQFRHGIEPARLAGQQFGLIGNKLQVAD